jgi:general secretion pathway protein A
MSPERVLFPASVVRGIHQVTRGIPRLINVLCDRMLLGAYGRNKSRADHAMLKLAAKEVLGEPYTVTPTWTWLAVAAAVGILVWAGGWLLGNYAVAPAPSPQVSAAPTVRHEPEPEPVAPPAAAAEPSGSTEIVPQSEVSAVAEPPDSGLPEATGIAVVMLPPGDSMVRLWGIYSEDPVPEEPCSAEVQSGLACFEGEAWTWDDLAHIDRPLSLEAITPERFSAEVLLLGMTGHSAWVLTTQGVSQVSLAALAPYWTGRYRFLWQVPEGFQNSLTLGQESDAVAAVATWFARLDGQPEPLADRRFNRVLQERVRLFQREHGLVDDGVVGLQTLLKLNEQLGVDITAEQARQRFQAAAAEGVEA